MYMYRVAYYPFSIWDTWSAGVYAATEEQALQIGAILISRKYKRNITASQLRIIPISGMTSNVMTTT